MFNVDGRRVKVVTGGKTQTINVCTELNQHGVYDYILRLRPPFTTEEELRSERFVSVSDLVDYLQNTCSADLEQSPGNAIANRVPTLKSSPIFHKRTTEAVASQGEFIWEQNAKRIIEESVDQLIHDFIAYPYMHRVEHSIHCELYRILKSHTLFASTYPMGRYSCQPVHKEWPEYLKRPEKRGRGNFDLCVIAPQAFKSATYDEFRQGRIKPFAAIEMGLDYKLDHLQQDAEKFENSGIENSYLVHLVRDDVVDNFVEVEKFIVQSEFKVAYARISGRQAFFKCIDDTDIQSTIC